MRKIIACILAMLVLAGCGAGMPSESHVNAPETTVPTETTYPIPEVTICTQEHEPWTPFYNYFESHRTGDSSGLADMAPAEYWRGRCMGNIGQQSDPSMDTMEKWQAWFEEAHGPGKDGYVRICGEDYTVQVIYDGYTPVTEEQIQWYREGLENIGISGERMTDILRLKDLKVVLTGSLGEHVEDFGNANNFVIKIDGRWYWAGVYLDFTENKHHVEFSY